MGWMNKRDSKANPRESDTDDAVIELVDRILQRAVEEGASDLHFEPEEVGLRVRCRVDGALREWNTTPSAMIEPIVSRIKVLGDLDIAEKRLPQDGRIRIPMDGRRVDFRISTLPAQFGESVVLRVLDSGRREPGLASLGMPGDTLARWKEVLGKPHGIVLSTGPTGSGKTTTLYGAIHYLNQVSRKLLTAEDPVEYEMDGVVQVPVNPRAGVDFARVVRAFLRQDPDVILVGEIRDLETAQVALQAALTGHMVLSTLHTHSAAGAVTRLQDMGVESYLLAATLEAVLAQRLVRRLCPECRRHGSVAANVLETVGLGAEECVWEPVGCSACGELGYRGRHGLFSLLRVTPAIRERLQDGVAPSAIEEIALGEGTRTIPEEARHALRAGITSIAEAVRV